MNAIKMLEEFPDQLKAVDCQPVSLEGYGGVVFSGMGGSGIVGDFMTPLIQDVPAISVKGYQLPPYVKQDWLVVCTSYSGNTEETISTLEEALKRGIKPVCISSGGKLREIAQKEGLIHIPLPEGYPPRYAFGFMLSALLSLFGWQDSLKRLREHLLAHREEIKVQAKEIACSMFTYLPVVYGTPLTQTVALRWKAQINENSKTLCYSAFLPEMHHNEVVGLENPQIRNLCTFTLLYDPQDHPRVIKRVELTRQIFEELGVILRVLSGKGQTLLERLIYLVYLGDWVSLHLANIYGQDPLPVKVIDFIKRSLV